MPLSANSVVRSHCASQALPSTTSPKVLLDIAYKSVSQMVKGQVVLVMVTALCNSGNVVPSYAETVVAPCVSQPTTNRPVPVSAPLAADASGT